MSSEWYLPADWPVPEFVRAGTTLRNGGISRAPFDTLNLGAHVGDNDAHVRHNREVVSERLGLPREPLWLNQIHGNTVVDADASNGNRIPDADAAVTRRRETVLAILTADCLPLVLCDPENSVLAAAHGGWRGLAGGIVTATIKAMQADAKDLYAWLGPAIGPSRFVIGDDVRDAFVSVDATLTACFVPTASDRYLADLYAIARRQLTVAGVARISGGHWCTYSDAQRFFSYRRDQQTGRMATVAWMT
ncbi:MAG: peptidoglycan editing factor PgeF [Gammaproteobacteria bacterium]|nr:peptidoglycan editing factor PgeF [Gammaproteobacteria bacterium]